VVADYAPTANRFFNSVIEQLVGLARRHAVPVIYMRREFESPLAAESVPIDASGLYKIAHSVDGNGSGKGNPATAKFTATTASEATDTA
jgi:hypothetical protein